LFTSERARTKVKFLSGGERHRLLLARLFTTPSNLLVFDEPTNDLDAETLELLEEVLLQYEGTLIVVSHDREFLNNVVTSVLSFGKDSKISEYIGGYDDWERQMANNAEPENEKPGTEKKKEKSINAPQAEKAQRKLSFKDKKELEGMPLVVEALESEQGRIHLQLADLALCQKPGFVSHSKTRLTEIETELSKALERWHELEELQKSDLRNNKC
jgi:ATP-binding cassette subfamily F protein uup